MKNCLDKNGLGIDSYYLYPSRWNEQERIVLSEHLEKMGFTMKKQENQGIQVLNHFGGYFSVSGIDVMFILNMDMRDSRVSESAKSIMSLLLAGF